MADIVLGHSTLEPYLDHKTNPLLRLDRRYANRITKGKYTLDASSGAGAIQLELPADLSASRSGFPATPSARAIRSSSAAVTRASIAGAVSR